MATRQDKRRPIRNALLKWQLLQDHKRIAEAQHRLMRMAVPSPASSLALDHSCDRRPTVRRPRPAQHHDPEEDALMKQPTGQKLNAAGAFYSPVRLRESALNSSSSEFRQSLAFSRIKAPAAKRLVERIDDEALWNDLFYGTKAARAKTNKLPQQPVVYSNSDTGNCRARVGRHEPNVIIKDNDLAAKVRLRPGGQGRQLPFVSGNYGLLAPAATWSTW
ncbi:hypothetical protein V7S43_002604 [Phytophthora oleae]|uniref:Uncharacterized protein n=1 Tax=Phytophthora oleae TaxID=2107226 RepID=A0ABD3FZZ1_9STRA